MAIIDDFYRYIYGVIQILRDSNGKNNSTYYIHYIHGIQIALDVGSA